MVNFFGQGEVSHKRGGGVTCSLRRFSLGFRVHKLGPVAREFRDLRALVPEEDPGGPRAQALDKESARSRQRTTGRSQAGRCQSRKGGSRSKAADENLGDRLSVIRTWTVDWERESNSNTISNTFKYLKDVGMRVIRKVVQVLTLRNQYPKRRISS